MTKEECVNGLKYMAAYKSMSLDLIKRQGLASSTPLEAESYVAVELSQLEVLKTAIFYLTGEEFVPPELGAAPQPPGVTDRRLE